jgi:hypothetical protein
MNGHPGRKKYGFQGGPETTFKKIYNSGIFYVEVIL